MRWIYAIERVHPQKQWDVNTFIDGRPGLGHARHRRKSKAMKLAEADYLKIYPVSAEEVVEAYR